MSREAFRIKAALLFCFLILSGNTVYGISIPGEAFPVSAIIPPGAGAVKQEELFINEDKEAVAVYRFNFRTGPQDVKKFYHRQADVYRWELIQDGDNLLIYKNAGFRLNVTIQDFNNDGVYDIILVKAKDQCSSGKCAGGALEPSSGFKNTDIDGIPRYSQAKVAAHIKKNGGVNEEITYYSGDSVEEIISFYKSSMPGYGWEKSKEINFDDVDTSSAKFFFGERGIQGMSILFSKSGLNALVTVIKDPKGEGRIISVRQHEK